MKPIFKNAEDWEQAELLMQPTLIRLVDNLRKVFEESPWQVNYEEIETPYPGHRLCLSLGDHSFKIDLWQLCFQICFLNYHLPLLSHQDSTEPIISLAREQELEVIVDSTLFNEQGEVDWPNLEEKTQRIIQALVSSLPN
ncbi:MAG: hypothetical protein ACRC6M_09650 [Microcystaceae cyanobacterium]